MLGFVTLIINLSCTGNALIWPPTPLKLPPVHGAVRPTISAGQVARVAGALKNICLFVKPVVFSQYDSSNLYGG